MRFTLLLCALVLGSSCVSNVDGTLGLLDPLGILGGGGGQSPQGPLLGFPGLGIFKEFLNHFQKIFLGNDGFNSFLDKFIKQIPDVFHNFLGVKKLERFFGPLSQIPDDVKPDSFLGDGKASPGKVEIFEALVQMAKKFCLFGKCDKFLGEYAGGDRWRKGENDKGFHDNLSDFFGSFGLHSIDGGLGNFHNIFRQLISSLGDAEHNEIFSMLSKLPDDFDPSVIIGKDSSSSGGDILSRKDMFDILKKYSKSVCSKGCNKSD